jgi:hypothetical protein
MLHYEERRTSNVVRSLVSHSRVTHPRRLWSLAPQMGSSHGVILRECVSLICEHSREIGEVDNFVHLVEAMAGSHHQDCINNVHRDVALGADQEASTSGSSLLCWGRQGSHIP